MKNTERFMELLARMEETNDDVLIYLVSSVSETAIAHVNNVSRLQHCMRITRLQLDGEDYRAELYDISRSATIALKALIASIKAVNRFLENEGNPALCGTEKMEVSKFAIELVNTYYNK